MDIMNSCVADIQASNLQAAIDSVGAVYQMLPGLVNQCGQVPMDIPKLDSINALFSNPWNLMVKISENAFTKGPQMLTNLSGAASQLANQQYVEFGNNLSSSLVWFFDI